MGDAYGVAARLGEVYIAHERQRVYKLLFGFEGKGRGEAAHVHIVREGVLDLRSLAICRCHQKAGLTGCAAIIAADFDGDRGLADIGERKVHQYILADQERVFVYEQLQLEGALHSGLFLGRGSRLGGRRHSWGRDRAGLERSGGWARGWLTSCKDQKQSREQR